MSDDDWSDRRGDAALEKAAALARARDAETRQAAALVKDFAVKALKAGIEPVRFTARSYGGSSRYKTRITGWYLKRDRSVGVSVDGEFYVLSTHRRLASLFTGAHVEPAEPPLELGRGGRDGESMPISVALDKRLAGGNDWG